MGCLFNFGKFTFIIIAVFTAMCLLMGAIMIDFVLVVKGQEPYFFNPDHIEAYDEPMIDDIFHDLSENYNKHADAILDLESDLAMLPDNRKLEVEYSDKSKISITAKYGGGYRLNTSFDYKDEENQEFMGELGITPADLDHLKIKVKKANCISFEKEDGLRLGFKNAKYGTFYYRFKSDPSVDYQMLFDSCLIKDLNSEVFIEYKGMGRGPDCIVNQNPEGYDDRGFFKKWYDLLSKDHETIFEQSDED